MRNTNPALAHAYTLDRQGRLGEAIAAYQKLLAAEPRNSDALHLLGVAMARSGRAPEGVRNIAAAAELQPDNPAIQANLGNTLNELGRHAEAVAHFERALQLKPDFVAAAHAGGRTLLLLGRLDEALQALQKAVRLAPENSNIHSDLGVVLERLGRQQEALREFETATSINPGHVEAYHNRGLLEVARGRLPQALDCLDRALALQPQLAAVHANRGNVLSDLGRTTEALTSFDRALALQPADAGTLRNRARALIALQRLEEAVAGFDAALAVQPQDVDSHFYRGVALTKLERYAEALASFDRALNLKPAAAQILNTRAIALAHLDRPEEAADNFAAAIASDPNDLEALENAANTARTLQRYPEALRLFDQALALQPDGAQLRLSKGLLLLTLGDYASGWPLHEARLEVAQLRPGQKAGESPRLPELAALAGRTVLVYAEQGLGDTLQFCRYIPLLEERGVRVVLAVQPALRLLLRSLAARADVMAYDQALPAVDTRLPLLSLPMMFGTRLTDIPAAVPYVHAEPARRSNWIPKLQALPGIKVGITWQGNLETEKQGGFRGRSFPLAALAPLARVAGVTLISLQKGPGARQRAEVAFGEQVIELDDPSHMGPEEMLDTAALIQELDLVVTSDTVTAHLAGALGVPVWIALSTSPDWRWLTEREDSPWYPNARLFRQSTRGEWAPVFDRIADELARFHGRTR
jgi:tetratricopeptide (TPR) repeat protein